jgi:hypothetical protein
LRRFSGIFTVITAISIGFAAFDAFLQPLTRLSAAVLAPLQALEVQWLHLQPFLQRFETLLQRFETPLRVPQPLLRHADW